MPLPKPFRSLHLLTGFLLIPALILALTLPARAADPVRLKAFLEVTGFDVALDSIRLSADSAPAMLGMSPDDFGSEWSRLVEEVFASDIMREMGTEILAQTLSDDLLTHGAEFYASDLGQRLVAAENKSHMSEDSEAKQADGRAIIDGLVRIGSPRVALLQRLNAASAVEDNAVKAMQEVQVRFLMAAASAGVVELQLEEADLRLLLQSQEGQMRQAIAANALAGSAYTYQAFSDAEVTAYAQALEHPNMQEVYALMNAVQYEIMANRFEAAAQRMSGLQPSQDL